MTFFALQELRRQFGTLSNWLTALGLFAAACFIIGWPYQHDLGTTRLVGPPSVWAFLVFTLYLALNDFWKSDLKSGFTEVLAAQSKRRFNQYALGRFLAAIVMAMIYTVAAIALGSLLFAIEYPLNAPWVIQTIIATPAIAALCLATAALTARANGAGSALGVLILVPMLAPILIFSQVYLERAQFDGALMVQPLFALVGLCVIYFFGGLIALPALLRTQI